MYLDEEGIDKLIREYERDTKAIKDNLYRLCWFMRGSLSVNESFLLTPEDQEIIGKIIEGNLEIAKNSQMPFF